MEINEFVKKFASKFEDTEDSEFKPETEFQELDEWDSMTALMIIALIRTEYNKKVSAIEIRNCKTIKDLYDLAETK
ncbi:MAG: acyl carrier protein [Bacteroidales bacterium]|nr:acyl carrier protein [Bacteroidales bacterium]